MLYNPLPIIITAVGAYLLVKLRGFFLLHPLRCAKAALGALSSRENFRAFTLALAGTLGVGNVLGVAVGLLLGGAGSLFWLVLSSLFSAVLKYAEVTLSSDCAERGSGGMFYLVGATFRRFGGALSSIYAIGCLGLSLVMGAALQSHSALKISSEIFDTPPALFAILFAFLVLLSIIGGGRKIAKITAVAIPVSTIVYIILTVAVIITRAERIPAAISEIMSGAFRVDAAAGGILGHLFSSSMREGYSRGILSNEAGAGTSTMAHTTGGELSAATRGTLGIFEVVFDTVILCSLSGLSILVATPDLTAFKSGTALILSAVTSSLGAPFALPLLFSVFTFAYATVVCWYYYGGECIRQLTGRERPWLFAPLFILATVLGAALSEVALVYTTDLLLLVLVFITLPTLIKNSDRLRYLSELSGLL